MKTKLMQYCFFMILLAFINKNDLGNHKVINNIEACKTKQLAELLERIYNQPNSEKIVKEFNRKISNRE